MRQAIESCLLDEDFWSSWEQRQLHPPSKLATTWAKAKSTVAPKPSMKALWLGSLHSNIHNLKCLTWLCKKKQNHILIYCLHHKLSFLIKKKTYVHYHGYCVVLRSHTNMLYCDRRTTPTIFIVIHVF
jgi:hypothetical protein